MKSKNIHNAYLSLLLCISSLILISSLGGCNGENSPAGQGNGILRAIPFHDVQNNTLTLSLRLPDTVPIGSHEVIFTLLDAEGNTLVDATDYNIGLSTQMKGMDHHGSHGSQNAVYHPNGKYHGKVELIMKGAWEIHAVIYKKGEKISTTPIVFYLTVA